MKEFHGWFLPRWNFCLLSMESQHLWELHLVPRRTAQNVLLFDLTVERKKKKEKIVIILRNDVVHICINSLTILPSCLLHYSCNSRKGRTFWCGPPSSYDVDNLKWRVQSQTLSRELLAETYFSPRSCCAPWLLFSCYLEWYVSFCSNSVDFNVIWTYFQEKKHFMSEQFH